MWLSKSYFSRGSLVNIWTYLFSFQPAPLSLDQTIHRNLLKFEIKRTHYGKIDDFIRTFGWSFYWKFADHLWALREFVISVKDVQEQSKDSFSPTLDRKCEQNSISHELF